MGAPVNGQKTKRLPSWHPQFETPPALVPGCGSSYTLFSSPSMSHKLLLHPSQSLSRANSPYNFGTVKLPFVNHDSSRTVSSHYCYIQHNSKSPSTLTELNESCNTKTGTHLFVGAQMAVKVCKGQREKDRERETNLETKITTFGQITCSTLWATPAYDTKSCSYMDRQTDTLLIASARP